MEEIEIGSKICNKLRHLYFQHESWLKCNKKVSEKFSALKKVAKYYYPTHDKNELIKEISKFSYEDIEDVMGTRQIPTQLNDHTEGNANV